MKYTIIVAMMSLALLACSKKEYPPEPVPAVHKGEVSGQNFITLPNTYESEIRVVEINPKTTCFVLTHSGANPNAISCVQK